MDYTIKEIIDKEKDIKKYERKLKKYDIVLSKYIYQRKRFRIPLFITPIFIIIELILNQTFFSAGFAFLSHIILNFFENTILRNKENKYIELLSSKFEKLYLPPKNKIEKIEKNLTCNPIVFDYINSQAYSFHSFLCKRIEEIPLKYIENEKKDINDYLSNLSSTHEINKILNILKSKLQQNEEKNNLLKIKNKEIKIHKKIQNI